MKLRRLELKDAEFMIEWMHDQNVVKDLRTDFLSKSLEDCVNFIKRSWTDTRDWNVAIVDENDTYMGTVSLKNIKGKSAEFGITIRTCAMGRGYAIKAMNEALKTAFEVKKLEQVYWCVSPENKRAVKFYEKNGFKRVNSNQLTMIEGYTENQINSYLWYMQTRG